MKRWIIRSFFIGLLLLFIGGWVTACAGMGMQSRLEKTKTSNEEATAFEAISNRHDLYSVDFLDEHDRPLGADRGERFEKVRIIVIRWANGWEVRHAVIDHNNIPLLLRQ